ncbi:hypothetical protein SAMN05421837_107393 [Amycolatopsis pretoriensis]|uniref:Uncharacterized protein n=1 Tax=Amycolatopsis pretoriensis TaxID=218821 RepID=A0A1H5RA99_9PSEU|nr:hypothetical protein [Amycolatopsis pretoriensis]SEF34448.1 hypothetical protein SAMN05421837_107393 [Amycolatopsis pretoriensis]
MPSYRVPTLDDQIRELMHGTPITFPWEWADIDGSPEQWAGQLGLLAMRVGLAVQVVTIPRHSLSIAWNADRPSPPMSYFTAVIERVNAARAAGGLVLPTKDELLVVSQVPTSRLRHGSRGLRPVPGIPPWSRPTTPD